MRGLKIYNYDLLDYWVKAKTFYFEKVTGGIQNWGTICCIFWPTNGCCAPQWLDEICFWHVFLIAKNNILMSECSSKHPFAYMCGDPSGAHHAFRRPNLSYSIHPSQSWNVVVASIDFCIVYYHLWKQAIWLPLSSPSQKKHKPLPGFESGSPRPQSKSGKLRPLGYGTHIDTINFLFSRHRFLDLCSKTCLKYLDMLPSVWFKCSLKTTRFYDWTCSTIQKPNLSGFQIVTA